jgi:hypothetical protein
MGTNEDEDGCRWEAPLVAAVMEGGDEVAVGKKLRY